MGNVRTTSRAISPVPVSVVSGACVNLIACSKRTHLRCPCSPVWPCRRCFRYRSADAHTKRRSGPILPIADSIQVRSYIREGKGMGRSQLLLESRHVRDLQPKADDKGRSRSVPIQLHHLREGPMACATLCACCEGSHAVSLRDDGSEAHQRWCAAGDCIGRAHRYLQPVTWGSSNEYDSHAAESEAAARTCSQRLRTSSWTITSTASSRGVMVSRVWFQLVRCTMSADL